jgi:hypothetical protein
VSNWEAGKNPISAEAMQRLKNEWHVNIEWLMGAAGSMYEYHIYLNTSDRSTKLRKQDEQIKEKVMLGFSNLSFKQKKYSSKK